MKSLRKIPLWLISGILYGLSWPIFSQPDLSYLAWFAFVPLFIYLEKNRDHFWKFTGGSYGAMSVFAFFSAGWLFYFPDTSLRIGLIFFAEVTYFFIPFLVFYFIQKRLPFRQALWLFPLIWTVWEWFYLDLEFTMGTHLLPYSQTNNTWLVQFADLTGMWGIGTWVLYLNVLLWNAWKKSRSRPLNTAFLRHVVKAVVPMVVLPLLYSMYVTRQYDHLPEQPVTISLIPTNYSAAMLMQPENGQFVVENTLYRTDSLAFARMDAGKHSDLYVWPETGMSYRLNYSNLDTLLQAAVDDYDAALLTGCKGVPDEYDASDPRMYVSGVLVSKRGKSGEKPPPQYHHKTVLTPGNEMIPYHRYLAKIPGFNIPETDPHYWKRGNLMDPLLLATRDGKDYRVGVSLCFEQWYPAYWSALARNGADFYVHIAGEGWYGQVGFQQFMANVTRMRCIENRRSAARCSNVGLSTFIDPLGRFYQAVRKGRVDTATAEVGVTAFRTLYARFPNWFPATCLFTWMAVMCYGLFAKGKTIAGKDRTEFVAMSNEP